MKQWFSHSCSIILALTLLSGLCGCCLFGTAPTVDVVRRDGSYFTRVEWSSHPGGSPAKWVGNLIDDDSSPESGVWEADTTGTANTVISFFGEKAEIGSFKIYDVGIQGQKPSDENVRKFNIYVSEDAGAGRLGSERSLINKIPWTRVAGAELGRKEGWIELPLEKPVNAKYVRIELIGNPKSQAKSPWPMMGEVKIFPPK